MEYGATKAQDGIIMSRNSRQEQQANRTETETKAQQAQPTADQQNPNKPYGYEKDQNNLSEWMVINSGFGAMRDSSLSHPKSLYGVDLFYLFIFGGKLY